MTIIVIDCPGKDMGCDAEAPMVLIVLPEVGGVIVACGLRHNVRQIRIAVLVHLRLVAVLVRLLIEGVSVSGP